MINQNDLKYFLEVSKTLHVSRAAERLGITQPALSHSLKRIEASVKTQLFVRTKKGVLLTKAGQQFLNSVQDLIQKWDEVILSAQNEDQKIAGLIKLGCHSAAAQYTLPRFVPSFLHQHPEVNLQLHHGLSRHMVEDVISQKLDIALAINPVLHPDLIIKEILKDTVALWRIDKCINKDILIADPTLLQTQDLIKKMQRKNIYFKRVIESSSLEVISQLVASGAGVGILPEKVIRAYSKEGLVRIKGTPEFQDRLCLVYKSEFRKSLRGKTLIANIVEKLSEKN